MVAGEPDELLSIGEWQWTEQEGVDDAENDDVGANAKGEDEDGDEGEGTIFAEDTEGVAKILEKHLDRGNTAGLAMIFFGLLHTAEMGEGLAARFGMRHAGLEIFFDG